MLHSSVTVGLTVGLVLAAAVLACAKADDPKVHAPAASEAAVVGADGGELDAAGALRALPMPQQFPRITLDAATFDASRDAAGR